MAEHCDTYSSIVAEAVSGTHVLKIDGYSRTKELLQNGTCAKSIDSSVGGHSWIIQYYPNGDRKEYADFVSLHLM
jgi:speckle-type POZ protein